MSKQACSPFVAGVGLGGFTSITTKLATMMPNTTIPNLIGCGSFETSTTSTFCNKMVDKGGATRGTYEVRPKIREPKEAPSWKQPTTSPPRLSTFFRQRAMCSIG